MSLEFADKAFVLAARGHGETGAIVEVLTAERGKWAAHVAGGASRRIKPLLQTGAPVMFAFHARTADQLGAARLEALGEGPAALFDDPVALAGLAAAAAVIAGALPEREAHPGLYLAFESLIGAFSDPAIWPAVLVRFEAGLLAELGFGLDLGRCAVSGQVDDLAFVSPRTGRAVSAAAGEPYRERLLVLPPFLLGAQSRLAPGDIGAGLTLTGHFLATCVFDPLNRPLPGARDRLIERLGEKGML